jgi:hypothetical protein
MGSTVEASHQAQKPECPSLLGYSACMSRKLWLGLMCPFGPRTWFHPFRLNPIRISNPVSSFVSASAREALAQRRAICCILAACATFDCNSFAVAQETASRDHNMVPRCLFCCCSCGTMRVALQVERLTQPHPLHPLSSHNQSIFGTSQF